MSTRTIPARAFLLAIDWSAFKIIRNALLFLELPIDVAIDWYLKN